MIDRIHRVDGGDSSHPEIFMTQIALDELDMPIIDFDNVARGITDAMHFSDDIDPYVMLAHPRFGRPPAEVTRFGIGLWEVLARPTIQVDCITAEQRPNSVGVMLPILQQAHRLGQADKYRPLPGAKLVRVGIDHLGETLGIEMPRTQRAKAVITPEGIEQHYNDIVFPNSRRSAEAYNRLSQANPDTPQDPTIQ